MKRVYKKVNSGEKNVGRKPDFQFSIFNFQFLLIIALLLSCKEQGRFEIGYADSEPPVTPLVRMIKPLPGGARIFFDIPVSSQNRDLLSIDATYVNDRGKTVWFSVSYFKDSIDVYGFSDTLKKNVQLYAVDRAGNKSEALPVPVYPLEPAYTKVARTLDVRAGFASFFLDWKNEIEQNINVYVDFSYTQKGQHNERSLIYTSNLAEDRWFIRDLELTEQEPVSVKVRVEDMYGNITDFIDKGSITLIEDEKISKDKWTMPEASEYVAGVAMTFLGGTSGRSKYVIDDIADDGDNLNFGDTDRRGMPWSIMIDLGDEYEISRIVTHQMFGQDYLSGGSPKGCYYWRYNIGIYDMYIMSENDGLQKWEHVRQHKILYPEGLSDIEYRQMGKAGDMAYLYPDDPKFSPPTRWFRYEARKSFEYNYTDEYNATCISEITLYGRKATR
jgi:hypothetical protein